ncbi:MAG: tetratricopeptide repeat protein [Acidobacteria bacterium]|nr:tetratricopeptide repeat protein [Acidobacteriota bacterium]
MRHQSFQLLLYFLKRPGVLITKDQLTEAIWNDTSVTDNALVQCITEIRRTLNDDPRKPRFIKTVPKIGYRLISPVEIAYPAPTAPAESPGTDVLAAVSSSASLTPPLPGPAVARPRRTMFGWSMRRIASLIPIAFLASSLCGDRSQARPSNTAAVFNGPETHILAVFPLNNATARPHLNWLRDGISNMILTSLERGGRSNAVSGDSIHVVRDDFPASATLTAPAALELAKSVHATEFVMGTISNSGSHVTIRIEARSGKDGHVIASDSTPLRDLGSAAEEANTLSAWIAHQLGVRTDAVPSLTDVGTENVEAYHYYSLGVEKVKQFQNSQAITLLEKAIQLDPKFAMAYARIGYAYAVMDFQPESANRYLKRATELSSSLPVLSRLYIEAWSAIARADYTTAIAVLQQVTKQYPDEIEAYCQLSRVLRGQERIAEAGDLLRAAIKQNPDAKDLYNNYGLILIGMGRSVDALDAYKQYVDLDPRNPNAHDSLGMAYQQAGQYSAALSEFNEALKLDPEFEPSIVHLGDAYYQLGQNQDAVREYQRYIHIASNSDAKAVGYGDLAVVYSTMNRPSEARSAAADELRYNDNSVWNSLVFALEDHRSERADALTKRLLARMPNPERGSPPDLRMAFFYRGYLALKAGDSSAAISYFKSALEHLPPSSGIDSHEDCLANAYFELGMLPEALAEYQRILNLNANYPLAYFHLGRTYRRLHDAPAAEDAFRHFLSSVPSADQDSPQIHEARQPV